MESEISGGDIKLEDMKEQYMRILHDLENEHLLTFQEIIDLTKIPPKVLKKTISVLARDLCIHSKMVGKPVANEDEDVYWALEDLLDMEDIKDIENSEDIEHKEHKEGIEDKDQVDTVGKENKDLKEDIKGMKDTENIIEDKAKEDINDENHKEDKKDIEKNEEPTEDINNIEHKYAKGDIQHQDNLKGNESIAVKISFYEQGAVEGNKTIEDIKRVEGIENKEYKEVEENKENEEHKLHKDNQGNKNREDKKDRILSDISSDFADNKVNENRYLDYVSFDDLVRLTGTHPYYLKRCLYHIAILAQKTTG